MKLIEIIQSLPELGDELIIYAARPWSATCQATTALEPIDGNVPAAVKRAGLEYFIEVSIAREFLEDWLDTTSSSGKITAQDQCQRLIQYAENDA